MANTILIGAQWGDEGKGKIIDVLTAKADIVVRSQGGNNAGHTIVLGGQKLLAMINPASRDFTGQGTGTVQMVGSHTRG